MKTRFTLFFIVALLYISQATVYAQATLYVSPTGGNNAPYSSWTDAATNIQDAVDEATAGDLVLVDDGTYVLSTNVSITKGITVQSVNGYSTTTVDGNNATRCFYINHADAVLDGFTIQNGYNPYGFGGNINIANGGTVQNSFITGGQGRDGGGVAIDDAGLIYNSIITGNSADNNSSNGYGGGVRLLNGGTVRGSVIYGNTSEVYGGGINIWNAGTVESCTIVDNTAPNGAGIRVRNNSTIINSIIYFNNGDNWQTSGSGYTFDYSSSTPALPGGTGNTTDDPLFENTGSNDFHLTSSSTLINAGLNQAWMTGAYDLDGNDRILESTVDIGAYEFSAGVNIVSDDFFPETTLQSQWRFFDPVGDGSYTMTGTNIEINVPGGVSHDLGTNSSPRILQTVSDDDFAFEAKFESEMTALFQMQGIVVHADDNNYIRFGTYSTDSDINVYSAVYNPNVSSKVNQSIGTETPPYLRVERTGDNWVFSYSFDGTNFTEAVNFNQAFAVSEVGVYAGNHNPNPAFISSVDYFRDLNDPTFSDNDVSGVTPPILEVWYGDEKDFGNIGNPQRWVNIQGRVVDPDGIGSVKYSLNGGSDVSLPIGPNGTRLENEGDFVTEIDRTDLIDGVNTVEITAADALGAETIETVTINYTAGNVWTLPYSADWTTLSSINDINDVANIVDGLWELTTAGIKTVEPGYDRLIVLGDETWTTNYEVTVGMTIHSTSSGSGVGFAIGWQGHEGTVAPRTQWPLEAIGWVRNFNSLRILRYNSILEESQNISMSYDTKYLLKAKSEDIGGGTSRFSVKIWEEGTTEPASYMITSDIPDRDGSVLLIAHKADVTWATIDIQPLTGNQLPSFTSSPGINAQVDEAYTYNITTSDPNASDVLTISASTLPTWLSFTDFGDGTAELTGTPTSGDIGSHSVELEVDDGNGGTNEQNFTIVVTSSAADLPLSDQFCGPNLEPFWTIYDPYEGQTGESTFGINNGALEISIPSGVTHDLAGDFSPRILQTVPDDDFGVEVKYNSIPSSEYQMQGIIVSGGGVRLRFETFYGTISGFTGNHFLANGYGISFPGGQYITQIGGAIPEYLRVVRNGDVFEFDYSYDGLSWTNIISKTLDFTVTDVGIYGANAAPFPAFTMQAEYFRNINDPIPSCSVVEVTSPNGGETWSGGDTENITWTSSDVTNVNIEFSSDNGSSWNTVATSVDASSGSYTFAVPNINSTECLVRISDTNNSSIFDISDAVFTINTVAVDPTITIGSSTTVAGSYVTIPIDLTAPSGFKIDYLLQGKIHFDASKLKFLYGDYDAGTLVNDYGWTGTFYSAIPGTVDIILSGANPLNNSGTMFYLTFQVIDGNAGSADLSASSAEWPVDVLETPLTVVDGSVTYSDNSGTSENRGDATLNYIVDIYDALAVIYHWVGIYPLSGQAFINADVNFDGNVNIKDYLKIIFFVYLHDWDFVFPSVSPSSSIVLNGGEFEDSETVSIPIKLANSSNVQSAEIQFEYDPNELEFINVHSNTMNLRTVDNNGTLSVVAASLEEISNGEIASLRFKKLNTSSSTEVNARYNLNEEQLSNNSLLTIGNGTITNVEDDIKGIPTEYELSQNYPNPFNPSTVIKFAVPKSGSYKLNVYNVLGQKVMTLIDTQLQVGYHSANFDGTSLASGIYFYSLEGANVNISKKMLLIK